MPRCWPLLGIALPRALLPGDISFEYDVDGQFVFDVENRRAAGQVHRALPGHAAACVTGDAGEHVCSGCVGIGTTCCRFGRCMLCVSTLA